MSAAPDTLTLEAGGSATSTITITSLNGFGGTVDLSVSDTLEVTGTLDTASVTLTPDGEAMATLTVTHDPLSAIGPYFISVDGTSGLLSESVLVFVNVVGPDFSLTSDPLFLTFAAGESGTSTITVTSLNGFVGLVFLTTDDLPPSDMTITLSTDSVALSSGESETVTLTVVSTESTPPGGYVVSIVGSNDSDSITHSTGVFVTITGPDFKMSAEPVLLEIPAGTSGTSTITIESLFEFTGTIALDVSPPPPAGITTTLDPTSISLPSGGTSTSILTISIDSSFPTPGFATISVVGTSGSLVHTAFILVIVPPPGIDLTASPDSLAIDPGSSATSTITVASLYGFEGPIALTASSSDPCLDVSLSLESVTVPLDGSATSILTVTVDSTTPDGIYYVVVNGDGGFPVFDSAVILVTVGAVDTTPPTWPVDSQLTSSSTTQTTTTLTWTPATDDTGVESYVILQDAFPVAMVPGITTTYTATGLSQSTTYEFQVVALDAANNFALGPTTTVTTAGPTNNPPVLNPIGDKSVDEGSPLAFTATATDPDEDPVTFTLQSGTPTGAAITSEGVFTWTPNESQGPGTYSVTIIASDGSSSDSETITVTVNEVNTPPTLDPIGNKDVQESNLLSFTATASDPDIPAQTLTFTITTAATGTFPEGAAISSSGEFSWTPTVDQGPGTYAVRVQVSDGTVEDYEDITITVTDTPVNNPPVLASIGDRTVNEGTALTFTATASDADGDSLTFSLGTGAPGGATITTSGTFTWTTGETQGPGTYIVTVIVSDGSLSDSETITVSVSEVNSAPILQPISDRTVQEGNLLGLQASASDSDLPSNTLTYSLGSGSPTGASITPSGAFSWTPTSEQGPGSYTVTVIVSDGTATDSESFTVTVTELQRAPTAPTPFYQEPWFYAVLAVVVVGVIGGAWRISRGRAKLA